MADDDAPGSSANPFLKKLLEHEERFLRWRRFARTRSAFIRGEPLHDWPVAIRRERGVMGPWTFDLYESVLAATPAILVLKVLDFLKPPPPGFGAPTAESFFAQAVPRTLREDTASIVPDVTSFLAPFWVPLSLTLFALLAVRAVLPKGNRGAEKALRVRDAYLYHDGAHGLLPQAVLNLSLAAVFALGARGIQSQPVALVALAGVLYFLAYESWRIYKKVPRFLFAVAGFPEGRLRWWRLFRKRTEAEKRWARFRRWMNLGGWALLLLNFFVLTSLTWLIATGLAFVRSLV